MAGESALHFVANLILFALLLLYWVRLFRPNLVTDGILLGTLLLFLSCQSVALLWIWLRLGPWAFAHPYLRTMLLIEAVLAVYLLLERWLRQTGIGAFVLTLAFAIHAYVILLIPFPDASASQISPFMRSPWYLLHLLGAIAAYGAYICAGGGAVGYFVTRLFARSRLGPRLPSSQDCQTFTRRALVIGFPWLSGSLVSNAVWAQLAWGRYWSWRLEEAWLLIVWLVLTITLHVRSMPSWQGKPLALLCLLGFALTLLTLPLLGQGFAPAW